MRNGGEQSFGAQSVGCLGLESHPGGLCVEWLCSLQGGTSSLLASAGPPFNQAWSSSKLLFASGDGGPAAARAPGPTLHSVLFLPVYMDIPKPPSRPPVQTLPIRGRLLTVASHTISLKCGCWRFFAGGNRHPFPFLPRLLGPRTTMSRGRRTRARSCMAEPRDVTTSPF